MHTLIFNKTCIYVFLKKRNWTEAERIKNFFNTEMFLPKETLFS